MPLIKIQQAGVYLEYNPRYTFILGLWDEVFSSKLYWNKHTNEFEIDQDPYGECDPIPLLNVKMQPDFSGLEFDANYQSNLTHFVVSTEYECVKLLYEILIIFHKEDFLINRNDKDHLSISFEKKYVREYGYIQRYTRRKCCWIHTISR